MLWSKAIGASGTLGGADIMWDLSSAVFSQSFSVVGQDTLPYDVEFKPDGTKMYVLGASGKDVNEYTLSAAWDISTAAFIHSFGVAAQENTPFGFSFKPDGTKMYVVGTSSNSIIEYTLSTPWDVSTSTFSQSFSIAAQETNIFDVEFKPDGTKMYVIGSTGDTIKEYDLSTAWSITSSVFVQSFAVGAEGPVPSSLSFNPSGKQIFIVEESQDEINQYDLITAWDVSSASFTQRLGVTPQDSAPRNAAFKPDGTKMYMVGSTNDRVYEYNLTA